MDEHAKDGALLAALRARLGHFARTVSPPARCAWRRASRMAAAGRASTNRPFVLSQYFADMQPVLASIQEALPPSEERRALFLQLQAQ